jgi:hypothetical protein
MVDLQKPRRIPEKLVALDCGREEVIEEYVERHFTFI